MMHLLLSNDDGYQAQGIQILAKHLQSLGHKITVVAPSGEQSAQSHAMTFYQPIRVRQILENTYAVDGSPADCVALALTKILPPHEKPDFVIAGINHGLNVGIDVNYSGTVGAATEASLMGYKAIAVSADVQQKKITMLFIRFLLPLKLLLKCCNKKSIGQSLKFSILTFPLMPNLLRSLLVTVNRCMFQITKS
jgi:5'-nucleotidase